MKSKQHRLGTSQKEKENLKKKKTFKPHALFKTLPICNALKQK